jgi:L-alanine-DL-glutamate epimerase-like enolase superfamily enzyme
VKVASVETTIVSVPYRHREVSSMVARDGVTDVLVRVETDDGVVGWGEACSGADVRSIEAAVRAMAPFVLGRDPWERERIREEIWTHGLWQFRPMTGNFAWAAIDMALWDVCGRAVGEPLHRLLGGLRRSETTYFYYLARGSPESLAAQAADGLARGFGVYYLKVGIDGERELAMLAALREALGPAPRIRVDANGAWSPGEALRFLERAAAYGLDLAEQPVRWEPVALMAELRARSPVPLAANEGLWTEADVLARLEARAQDVLCFSPYWVGSLGSFVRLAHLAHLHGVGVCKHTHGELGLAAAACQHALLALPEVVDGHQQTAYLIEHDILREPLPIATGPSWGVVDGAGLGVEVDEAAVADAAERYRRDGQFLPWQPEQLGRETR